MPLATNDEASTTNNDTLIENKQDKPEDPSPTDRANCPVNINDANVKKIIIKNGSCKAKEPFPRDNKNRCFSSKYYYRVTMNGDKVPRKWLCYSLKLDSAYFELCWLFGDCKHAFCQQSWGVGIKDWQGTSRKIKAACVIYDTWRNNETIDLKLEAEYRDQVSCWTQVLKEDQLSQVFRYVTVSHDVNEIPIEIKINESFLGFHNITNQSAQGPETKLVKMIEDKGLPVKKCTGQGYDGASTISGIYSDVQKRIHKTLKHNATHNLNLILNDISENREFYDIVQQLYIILLSKKTDVCSEAMGLKKCMETFKFLLLLVIVQKKHFDKPCEGHRLSNPEEHFKVAVLYTNVVSF
ncbi:ZMYM5 protein, partial [Polyodon spathula]|nr:ZMYM5 protein [Polyodon spathula]